MTETIPERVCANPVECQIHAGADDIDGIIHVLENISNALRRGGASGEGHGGDKCAVYKWSIQDARRD